MNDSRRNNPVMLEDLLRLKRAERPPAEFWAEFERGMKVKQAAALALSREPVSAGIDPALSSIESEISPKASVALEDLLRLKRAERPPQEFWAEFERGMRAKQLAAIVAPRPWWAPFIRFGAKVSRYQLPVGAAAILTVTFLTLREYRTINVAPVYEPAVASTYVDAPAVTNSIHENAIAARVIPVSSGAPVVAEEMPAQVVVNADTSADQDQRTVRTDTMVGAASHVAPTSAQLARSSLAIDTPLVELSKDLAVTRDEFETRQFFGSSVGNMESRPRQQEPLAQMKGPRGSRRAPLFGVQAQWASASSSNDSALRDDQSASRLTERKLNEIDAISRVKLGGDRLELKF